MKKILIILSLTVCMTNASAVFAHIVRADWSGAYMLVFPDGTNLWANADAAGMLDPFGARTPLQGTLEYDTDTGTGTMVIQDITFFGAPATFTNVTFQAIGDGVGGPGSLIIISFNAQIFADSPQPVHLVADAQGFFDEINGGYFPGGVISNTGIASCTDDAVVDSGFGGVILPVGPIPVSATNFNVNQDGSGMLVTGGLPLSDDGFCGIKTATGSFIGQRHVIDITSIIPTEFPTAPKLVRADWSGIFMFLTPNNGLWTNADAAGVLDPFGVHTPVSGTLVYEPSEGQGWLTVDSFIFSGAAASIKDIRLKTIGDGAGGPGDLMRISFTGGIFGNPDSVGQPAHLVVDAGKFLHAVSNETFSTGTVLTGSGATSCSNQNLGPFAGLVTPIGPSPIAMTNQNLVQTGHAALIDGGTPLVDDGTCGVPLVTEPFVGFSFSFDFTSITSKGVIPLP